MDENKTNQIQSTKSWERHRERKKKAQTCPEGKYERECPSWKIHAESSQETRKCDVCNLISKVQIYMQMIYYVRVYVQREEVGKRETEGMAICQNANF